MTPSPSYAGFRDEDEFLNALAALTGPRPATTPAVVATPAADVTPAAAPDEEPKEPAPVASTPSTAQAPAAAAPVAKPAATAPATDEETLAKLAKARQAMARPGGYGMLGPPPKYQGPNAGETVLATLADVLLNRGRNVGAMIERQVTSDPDAVNYARQQEALSAEAKRQHEAQMADLLGPEKLAARLQELAMREKQLGLAEKGVDLRAANQARDLDPNNPVVQHMRDTLVNMRTLTREQVEGMDAKALTAAYNAATSSIATHTGAPGEAATTRAGQTAGEVAKSQHPYKMAEAGEATERQLQADEIKRQREETQAAERRARSADAVAAQVDADPHLHFASRDIFVRAANDPQQLDRVSKRLEMRRTMQANIDEMIRIRRKYGASWLNAENGKFSVARRLFVGAINSASNQGVLNPGEDAAWREIVPTLEPKGSDVIGGLTGRDIALEKLEGAKGMANLQDGAYLQGYGIGIGAKLEDVAQPPAAAPTPAPAPAPARKKPAKPKPAAPAPAAAAPASAASTPPLRKKYTKAQLDAEWPEEK